jgi:DNA-binding NarL/FixJ family response regulator
MRVLLADDHVALRHALARALSAEPDIEIVGEAENGQVAVARTRELRPDAVIMDVHMPVMSGVEATRLIHAELPDVCVIGLSAFTDPHETEAMMNAGAFAMLAKGESLAALIESVRECFRRVRSAGA